MTKNDAAERLLVARRRAQALELRIDGATWATVAERCGYADKAAACKDISRMLESERAELGETVQEYRELELARLDRYVRAATAVLERKHVLVSHGRVVREGVPYVNDDGEAVIAAGQGEPLLDDGPVLQAIDRLTRLSESRRKLLGLDAPAKAEISGPGETYFGVIDLGGED